MLAEVTNAVRLGGLRVEQLPQPKASTSSQDSKTSSIFGSDSDHELHGSAGVTRQGVAGTGGPAGLWHFIYRSSFLDQFVASEFSPPLHIPSAQKRYVCFFLLALNDESILDFLEISLYIGAIIIWLMFNFIYKVYVTRVPSRNCVVLLRRF